MKILAFSHTGLTTGGAEQCLLEYVDALIEQGHECKVIVPHEGAMQKTLQKKNIEVAVIGYGWAIRPHKKVNAHEVLASNGNSLAKIFHEVEKFKPDAIVVNTVVIPWGLYAGRLFNIPTTLLVHEIINEKDPSLDVLPSYEQYVKILNENTDFVVYNSEFVKSQYSQHLTIPKTSKKILYPLPPLSKENINRLYKRNSINKEETLKIAIFGALAPRKNQLEALEAIKLLVDSGDTNFRVDLYGDAAANLPYVRMLKEYMNKHALNEYVKIKGFTTSVFETMNEYNVVVSTSTYEPFGRTIVEGQLFGRVVIANNTGGGPELIRHGETGLIYKLGNPKDLAKQIKWVLSHGEDAVSLGARAKTMQARKFLTTARHDALIEAIEHLKNNNRPVVDDLFNPIRSLYEYNHQINERYKKFERLVNNRATRAVKHTLGRVKSKAKRLVKEILVK